MFKRFAVATVVLLYLVLSGSVADAQSDFGDLHVQPGDTVFVTDSSGATTTGPILTLSAGLLRVRGTDFTPASALRIQKRGDPIWDGGVKGLLAGAVVGALISGGECGVKWSFARCTAAGAGWGAALGTVIDWLHVGRTTIYIGSGTKPPPVSGSRQRSIAMMIGVF